MIHACVLCYLGIYFPLCALMRLRAMGWVGRHGLGGESDFMLLKISLSLLLWLPPNGQALEAIWPECSCFVQVSCRSTALAPILFKIAGSTYGY
ncbi:hypothetical protein BDW59DRAFT_51883 [Aspergillus cavernicola]|uniref:Secreted protein n=1 Tax=Aspergillus cavernicola TaxID=176166 RepID=A0ABR4IMX2_9EURO